MLEALWEMIFIFIPLLFRVVCVCGMLSASHREMKARAEKIPSTSAQKLLPEKFIFIAKIINWSPLFWLMLSIHHELSVFIVAFVCVYIFPMEGVFRSMKMREKAMRRKRESGGWRGGSSRRRGQNEKSIENDEKVLNVNFLELRDGKLNSRWLDTIN